MNSLTEWKNYFESKKLELIKTIEHPDEIDVQVSDEEEYSQSLQLKSMIDSLLFRTKQNLVRVNQALLKISNGTFGECDDCGDKISEARLKAKPDSILCIGCAEEEERRKKQYVL